MAILEISKGSNMIKLLSAQARGEQVDKLKAEALDAEIVK